jgi:pimeloyl-ACP methyl ester carboxylesterase
MEPPSIRYATTSDGYRIAYCVSGAGLPLVLMPQPHSHLRHLWHTKYQRSFFEALAQRYLLVQYDGRGQGLSDRGLSDDFAIADYLLDLQAVIDALGLDRFLLFGTNGSNHTAVLYASSHPGRLHGLLVWQLIGDLREAEPSFVRDNALQDWSRFLAMFSQICADLPAGRGSRHGHAHGR